jgi:NADPH-dependent glutamate synthase beta subunit-like oxidoreductase
MGVVIIINGEDVAAEEGITILEAAESADLYIPRLCYHPSLGSSHGLKPVEVIYREDGELHNDSQEKEFSGCRLCLVEIEGRDGVFTACDTIVEEGMVVNTETKTLKKERRNNLADILREHPHACLLCAQQEGCSRTQCSTNVPEDERCCPLLGHCELQKVAGYIGVKKELTKYVFKGLPKHESEALFNRDYNLCISCLRCVRACRDLRGIEALGFVYQNEKVVAGPTKSSIYGDSDCRFCGACAEVCPTGAIVDKDLPMGEKEDVLLPCVANCPAGIDIPGYIHLISEGKYSEGYAVIKERMPFPGILGRICFRPCEDACRRAEVNQPMGICGLKWFVSDKGSFKENVKESTGKKVVIVGSGPAGLSAAYYLARLGHAVTVLEAEEKIGGMLRYAIPDYRLPPEVLDDELRQLDELNIVVKCNTALGKDFALSDLRKDFDAVFLGMGACLSKKTPVEGAELEGVLWGLDFLRAVKNKQLTNIDGKIFVVGGGNVAMDVARTAIRLGTGEVQLACLESAEEMPAHDWEIEEAREEGVIMHPSWGPKLIMGEKHVAGIELVKCISVYNSQGYFSPVFDDPVTKTIETDTVILAIGQTSDLSCAEGIDIDSGTISTQDCATDTPGIFAGGEAARGPASVVEAVADGALAASKIDKYLGGDGNIYEGEAGTLESYVGKVEGFAAMERVDIPKRAIEDRKKSFAPVELGYEEVQAKKEAVRCLRCDLRLLIQPVTLPPDKWMDLNEQNVAEVPATEGVFQLLDEDKNIIVIKGTQDMQADLLAKLNTDTKAMYFGFEADPMYSKRESELIQQYLQQFGKMPEGDGAGDELDDLF